MASSAAVDVSQFDHTPYYCEENAYFLCKNLCANGMAQPDGSDLYIIFISNDKKQIALWHQKASKFTDGLVLWDYHVICVQRKTDSSIVVWDLDSALQFPSPLAFYVSETTRPWFQLFPEYQRFFRIVHASIFLRHFASDRRHMKEPDGTWQAQPPANDPIVAEDGTVHNLNEYMDIKAADAVENVDDGVINTVHSEKLGIVIKQDQLEKFFTHVT
ncbi:hypothetical protein EUGRSUZ_A02346 [Eucalyptus grandis]|uniref:Uncharacterized protein n=2 Tax=Eucalyptus grandis TaxID=71139 RepID=A0ACC3M812_EUCGR|nr:hypothetical protein EUGRSUZ_A02346 [Eucalyptus grandis]